MQALAFYLSYPFIYLIASLPFFLLYRLSDFLYYLLKLSGYRRNVILTNLRKSFPEKTEKEIQAIADDYLRYLCDLILETFKTLKMDKKESGERCTFQKTEWLEQLHRENKSIIIVMGHYGNWEWAGPGLTIHTPYQLIVIYRPLTNPYFEKMMVGMRTRFGTKITPASKTLRDMMANKNNVTATAFIADQSATWNNPYWITFLNQDTNIFNGPEKLAIKFNYPVVFMNVTRPKRGYYHVAPELLFAEPQKTQEGEISEAFTKRLEKEIIKYPPIWLWSHKRWKHTRQKPASL